MFVIGKRFEWSPDGVPGVVFVCKPPSVGAHADALSSCSRRVTLDDGRVSEVLDEAAFAVVKAAGCIVDVRGLSTEGPDGEPVPVVWRDLDPAGRIGLVRELQLSWWVSLSAAIGERSELDAEGVSLVAQAGR